MIRKIFDKFFLMSKSERRGLSVLMVLLGVVILFRFTLPVVWPEQEIDRAEFEQRLRLLDQLSRESESSAGAYKAKTAYHPSRNVSRPGVSGKSSGPDYSPKEKVTSNPEVACLFEFDPNTAGEDDFLRLGFHRFVAGNILRYRDKGGRFGSADDLLRIYGIDSALVFKLEPYIKIADPEVNQVVKKLELNSADTSDLKALPGIGSRFAARICKYRDRLGGFYSGEQLREVYLLTEETYLRIADRVYADTSLIRTINLNFATIDELKNHPYLRFEKARKIIELRAKQGPFYSLDQLLTDSLLSETELAGLTPYLSIGR